VHLKVVAVTVQQRLPVEAVRDHLTETGLQPLVGHLQEQQVRELLDVVDRGHPVVTQDVAVVEQLLHELIRRRSSHQAPIPRTS
jgi:hypothetical protein